MRAIKEPGPKRLRIIHDLPQWLTENGNTACKDCPEAWIRLCGKSDQPLRSLDIDAPGVVRIGFCGSARNRGEMNQCTNAIPDCPCLNAGIADVAFDDFVSVEPDCVA